MWLKSCETIGEKQHDTVTSSSEDGEWDFIDRNTFVHFGDIREEEQDKHF